MHIAMASVDSIALSFLSHIVHMTYQNAFLRRFALRCSNDCGTSLLVCEWRLTDRQYHQYSLPWLLWASSGSLFCLMLSTYHV